MRKKLQRSMGIEHGPAPELSLEHIALLNADLDTRERYESTRLKKRALLYLGLGSGMRISEMLCLAVKHVIRETQATWHPGHPISVKDQILLTKHITKNKKSRIVDITPQAKHHIHAWVDFLLNVRQWGFEQFLFFKRSDRHLPINTDIACYMFRCWGKRAGLDRLSTHSMRRTHANSLRRIGVDIKIIKEQLGHASLHTTDAYLHVDPLEKALKIKQLKF